MTYLLIKEDGLIYGYHTKSIPNSIETNLDPQWLSENTGKLYYIDGKYYRKEPNNNKEIEIRIAELIQLLQSTDWKVIVNNELKALGQPAKYDEEELHSLRQGWRDDINLLEAQLSTEKELTLVQPIKIIPSGINE